MHDPAALPFNDDHDTFHLELADDDERFARIMNVWLDWLRRKARESSDITTIGGVHG